MMYFCPCPPDPTDEPEAHAFVPILPRNLSYVQESYLDQYSVSGGFVHNPKTEREIRFTQEQELARHVTHELGAYLSSAKDRGEGQGCVCGGGSSGRGENSACVGGVSACETRGDYSTFACSKNAPCQIPRCEEDETSCGNTALIRKNLPSLCGNSPSGYSACPVNSPCPPLECDVYSKEGNITKQSCFDTSFQRACSSSSKENQTSYTNKPPPRNVVDKERYKQSSDVRDTHYEREPKQSSSYDTDSNNHKDQQSASVRDCHFPGLFAPLTNAASRLTYLLRSPPNECMNSLRNPDLDIGSSVDGEPGDVEAQSRLINPDHFSPVNNDVGRGLIVNMEHLSPVIDRCMGDHAHEPALTKSARLDVASDNDAETSSEPVVTAFHQSDTLCGTLDMNETSLDSREANLVHGNIAYGTPESDAGVFFNMEDADSHDKSTTVSEVSDDTCISEDSVYLSPTEEDFEEENLHSSGQGQTEVAEKEPPRKMSLQEALERAATDLNKMAMLPQKNDNSLLSQINSMKVTIPDKTVSTAISDSPVYPEEEFNFNRAKLRKSSSLKTNKTPPGTPHRKKAVRFADALGLDLESVRHVINNDAPPKIPDSAMADLRSGLERDLKEVGSVYLTPCFKQPGASDDFQLRVAHQKVCLENAIVSNLTITGFIRVANISFDKVVRVRYSHNDWITFHDIGASYIQGSCDGPTDRFSFSIVAPPYFVPGCRLHFAVSYNADGVEYWDNNNGGNYAFECFGKVPTSSDTAWMHFI